MAELNSKQLEAIEASNDSIVIIAGAGSGKTTVITKKIEKLVVENLALPSEILAITFTNKAANEMKERLLELLGPVSQMMWVMTFHAFCIRIIRSNLDMLPNLKSDFNIIDDEDKKSILKQIIKRRGLTEVIKVKQAMYGIGNAKSKVSYQNEITNVIDFDYIDIYKDYFDYLSKNNAIDFDDILLIANELLDDEIVKHTYQSRFRYMHVDEFQDTSKVQFELLEKLKCDTNHIFIVGDIDQSIYGWRGALIDNLLNIEKKFPNTQIIKLEQNYRSTKNILNAANDLIGNNISRLEKNLWTDNLKGEKVRVHRFPDAYNEAGFVLNEIKFLDQMGRNLDEIAVLYRANYQSKKIEEQLMQNNIAYVIYGGIRFYETYGN